MMSIQVKTISESYEKVMRHFQWNLHNKSIIREVKTEDGKDTWQSVPLYIEISDPCNSDWIHKNSPYGKQFYQEYIDEIVNGKNAGKFDYDYHSRLFSYDVNTDVSVLETSIPDNDRCKGHITVIQNILKQRSLNQIKYIIDKLKITPTTRRALAITWEPNIDEGVINVPCLQYIQFWIQNNKLNMFVLFRSEDMAMGYPMNVVGIISLMIYVSDQVGISCGTYHHQVVVPHVYFSDKTVFNKWM